MPVRMEQGHVYPFVCLQIDIAGHSKLGDPERILYEAKRRFYQLVKGIIDTYRGVHLTYAGDGGAYLFPIGDGKEYDEAVRAGFRILEAMPSINREIQETAGLTENLSVRISLDSGTAIHDPNPGLITGAFLNLFLKNEREIGTVNAVAVTERVRKQLTEPLRKRFGDPTPSEKLDCGIYRSNP